MQHVILNILAIQIKASSQCFVHQIVFLQYYNHKPQGGGGCYCPTSNITTEAITPPVLYVIMVLRKHYLQMLLSFYSQGGSSLANLLRNALKTAP